MVFAAILVSVIALAAPAALASGPPVGVALWTAPGTKAAGGTNQSAPGVVGGVVYEAFSDNTLRAYTAATGAPLWTSPALANVEIDSTPVVENGLVFVISSYEFVTALNATTGAVVWQYDADATLPADSVNILSPYLAVADGVLVMGQDYVHKVGEPSQPQVLAISASTGQAKWTTDLAVSDVGDTRSVINHGRVLAINNFSPNVASLNLTTGHLDYEVALGSNSLSGVLTVADGVGYAGSSYGNVYAFTVATGAIVWSAHPGTARNEVQGGPLLYDGHIYVGDIGDYDVYALSTATGATTRTYPVPFTGALGLEVKSGEIYGPMGTNIRAVSVTSGDVQWIYRSGSKRKDFAPPTVVAGVAYTATYEGDVYAIHGPHQA